MTDIRERILMDAEEAAGWSAPANDDTVESETGFWRTGLFVLAILAFAAVCFCAGAFLAAAWEVGQPAPAGVMDGSR